MEISNIDLDIEEQQKKLLEIKEAEEKMLKKNPDEVVCSCGTVLNKKSKFCTNCGEKIAAYCSCGEEISEGAKFCTGCGNKIE